MNRNFIFLVLLGVTMLTLSGCSTNSSETETEQVDVAAPPTAETYDSSSETAQENNAHSSYDNSEAERERMMNYVQSNSNLKKDEIDGILRQNGY